MGERDRNIAAALGEFSLEELRQMWDLADDMPGQVAEGHTQGHIAQEIERRVKVIQPKSVVRSKVLQPKLPDIYVQPIPESTHQIPFPETLAHKPKETSIPSQDKKGGADLQENNEGLSHG